MPISASDPRYLAEFEPPEVMALRGPLCAAYARPVTAFGCKGNLVHASGYHRSFNWITQSPDSRYRWSDYSIQSSLDNTDLDRNACSALDFVPGEWGTTENRRRMREITSRVHAAAKARDPRVSALREFAGTLDGRTVVTFNCSDGSFKNPFDSSHLDHVHASFWRSRVRRNHAGLLAVMIGDDMLTSEQEQMLRNVHDWLFDYMRGLVAADPGTPHIGTYVPNQILTTLRDRPAAVGLSAEDRASIVADLKAAVVGELAALLPSAEDINAAVDAAIEERLNGATIHTTGH